MSGEETTDEALPVVDQSACCGYGLCADNAPSVFVVGDDRISEVRPEVTRIDASQVDGVQAAIEACPTHAINWKRQSD